MCPWLRRPSFSPVVLWKSVTAVGGGLSTEPLPILNFKQIETAVSTRTFSKFCVTREKKAVLLSDKETRSSHAVKLDMP